MPRTWAEEPCRRRGAKLPTKNGPRKGAPVHRPVSVAHAVGGGVEARPCPQVGSPLRTPWWGGPGCDRRRFSTTRCRQAVEGERTVVATGVVEHVDAVEVQNVEAHIQPQGRIHALYGANGTRQGFAHTRQTQRSLRTRGTLQTRWKRSFSVNPPSEFSRTESESPSTVADHATLPTVARGEREDEHGESNVQM